MLRMVETFSGIGAQSKALRNANIEHEILNTADWDINAIIAYDLIHSKNIDNSKYSNLTKDELLKLLDGKTLSLDGKKAATREMIEKLNINVLIHLCGAIDRTKNLISVTDIKGEDLPNDMNILTYSFPCQDLSVAGFWHGNKGGIDRDANNRSSMLWQIERMLLERKKQDLPMPRFLLMENVRNITSHQHVANFNSWKKSLEDMGYKNIVLKLDSSYFGIPQKRVRIYMISILSNNDREINDAINEYFANHDLQNVNYVCNLNIRKTNIEDILKIDYTKEKYKKEADFSQPNDTKSRRDIYNSNCHLFDGKIIKQEYISTLTTKQDRHPNSGVIDYDNGKDGKSKFRYITPREGFMFMGFSEDDYEVIVNNNFQKRGESEFFTRDKLNKMAGNSIVVNVLEEIFKQIEYINNYMFVNNE